VQDVDSVLKLNQVHSPISPARVVGPDLPDQGVEPMQRFGTLMFQTHLRLIECKAQALSNPDGEAPQDIERVSQPHQLSRPISHDLIICQNWHRLCGFLAPGIVLNGLASLPSINYSSG
jgi:hypothetical protein